MSNTSRTKPRVAVLLYGLLREYRATAPSLLRHVVHPNSACVFYFGPAETDAPTNAYFGRHDERGFLMHNPKAIVEDLQTIEPPDLAEVYGACLRDQSFHAEPQSRFIAEAAATCSERDWLFRLNPYRIFSMFFNLQGAARLLVDYESRSGETFDIVIITRPDLAFYTPIVPNIASGEIHLAKGQGFESTGVAFEVNAPIYYYKNVTTGDYLPGGRRIGFNDQILAVRRENLEAFLNIYDAMRNCLAARVPASPESILYLLLVGRAGLKDVQHPDWNYEIHRAGARLVESILDIRELREIDPYHPSLPPPPAAASSSDEPPMLDRLATPLTAYKRYRKLRRAVLNICSRVLSKVGLRPIKR